MPGDQDGSYPIPEDPALAEAAIALREAGYWAVIVDDAWRIAYVTNELRHMLAGLDGLAQWAIGRHIYGPDHVRLAQQWRFGSNTIELQRRNFLRDGGVCLADTPGGREALREFVDPSLRDLVDELTPREVAAAFSFTSVAGARVWEGAAPVHEVGMRVHNDSGALVGTVLIYTPAVGMTTIGTMTALGDARHFARMLGVAKAGRRAAAILFADLDSSTPLAKRLPTATYFAFCRRLIRVADECVIDAGGLIGRHAGDGVVAFFLAETAGTESAAARACISTAQALSAAVRHVAERSALQPRDAVLRFGLHWGSTLYVGHITTAGRTEVGALGDEVNESARLEACATGGRILASKTLIERLDHTDAHALGIDPNIVTYTQLADIPTATDKARRDAPALAVCDLPGPRF